MAVENDTTALDQGMRLYMWLFEQQVVATGNDPRGLWPTPTFAALVHLKDHSKRCELRPCKAAGVSCALFEIAQHVVESELSTGTLADALDGLAHELKRLCAAHSDGIRVRAAEIAASFDQLQNMRVDWSADHFLSSVPRRLVERLQSIALDAADAARCARMYLHSSELQRKGARRKGRPAQVLLTAVAQHLYAGGFSPAEIAGLIPDGLSCDTAEDRVKDRLRVADCRSFELETDAPRQ